MCLIKLNVGTDFGCKIQRKIACKIRPTRTWNKIIDYLSTTYE